MEKLTPLEEELVSEILRVMLDFEQKDWDESPHQFKDSLMKSKASDYARRLILAGLIRSS